MDKYSLVEKDIEDSRKLINALDKSGIYVEAALWYYNEESEIWRLLIATPKYNEIGIRELYVKIRQLIDEIEQQDESFGIALTNTSAISPEDDIIKSIRTINTDRNMKGKRFRHAVIDQIYVDDVYILRSGSLVDDEKN